MKELTVWLRPNLEVARRLSGYYANRYTSGNVLLYYSWGAAKDESQSLCQSQAQRA
jgi:hypothetical protein